MIDYYYYYLDVVLELPEDQQRTITPAFFKNHIIQAVNQLFGETASAINVDVLKYNPETREAILRVPKNYYVKLRSSLVLVGRYEGIECAYRVRKAAPLLLNLIGDSRKYKH